jgi:integrase
MPTEKEPASRELATIAPSTLSLADQRKVSVYKERPRTKSTLRAYRTDWKRFLEWCARGKHVPFPASEDVIVAYLLDISTYMKPASLQRAYAALRVVHQAKGEPLPRLFGVEHAMERIRRERAANDLPGVVKKRALEAEQVIEAVGKLPLTLTGLRDRVVLLFGFAIGQRRAEIASVRVQDLEPISEGFKVHIRRSKTDQAGAGTFATVIREGGAGCPVAAVEAWLEASGIEDGALIRRIHRSGSVDPRGLSPDGVAQIVKAAAKSLGLNPREFGGHSLRRGFVTSAAKKGKPLDAIMNQTGHKNYKIVMGYIDESTRVERAAGRGLLASKLPAPNLVLEDQEDDLLLFHRKEQAVTKGWVKAQLAALEERGMSRADAVKALQKIGVTRYKRPIEASDL